MAELSPDEKSIIKDYLLAGSLDNVCGLLQEAEAIYETRQISSDNAIDSLDQLYQNLFKHLQRPRFNHDYHCYRPLVRLVIQKAADTDIWKAVYDLIATVFRETPLASVLPLFDATPVRFISVSQKGTEQMCQLDFFTKYFEGKDWSVRADAICQCVLESGSNSEWARFSDPPVQNAVLDWWLWFQDNFLLNARGVYFLVGDLGEIHDWKNICVIGELKKSSDEIQTKSMLLQLACYVQEVFITKPAHQFMHVFVVCGTNMKVWMFDCSGPYQLWSV
ncbi:conserved hypothetical protein [Coccidioides posadasii str. Silveira]|uniref:Fungal-type protein kinase domain-containing protein n=1 Tax=Coccidioides posadasii (strain RMSCC 757 / Silveira) TaxID=443226 RepID=E9CYW8_COCPS|nr:conserved hypothetical protein [Coccidioides posadasii str. Silveira]